MCTGCGSVRVKERKGDSESGREGMGEKERESKRGKYVYVCGLRVHCNTICHHL